MKNKTTLMALLVSQLFCQKMWAEKMPSEFVELKKVDPSIVQDMRLAGAHNFVGRPIKGYRASKCILTKKAARALAEAQAELKINALSLKVYDCYRPQRAVDELIKWAEDPKDLKMKEEFFPHEEKKDLFEHQYLAKKSSHCRGSAVDITIVKLPLREQEPYEEGQKLRACNLDAERRFGDNSLDMGTGYDCFDALSTTDNPKLNWAQKQNRENLKSLLEKHGFKNLKSEWWHYTFDAEPFPHNYFDFEIK